MAKDTDFKEAVYLINKSQRILTTTHMKPDGDAIGCISAIADALRALGKDVKPLLLSPMPEWYRYLFTEKVPVLGEDIRVEELTAGRLGRFDLIIVVDTNSAGQLADFMKYLKQIDTPVLAIDHHRTSGGIGALEIVESDAAAAGLVVLELFKSAGWKISGKIADALFVAISTDTGWFKFGNADSRVFAACAELIDLGAGPSRIYQELFETSSYERFRLKVLMLNTLELHLDGKFATMQIKKKDFDATGSTYADTENLINESRVIKTVDTTALFIELDDGRVRCSLRSKGALDVGRIAEKFGGGGHKMAAGTFVPAPIENARRLIYNEVSGKLK